jgi:hypothetical protein
MRAGVRGPCRSGPRRSGSRTSRHVRHRVRVGLDHSAGAGRRQATQRRGAGAVCTPESSHPATAATARRRRHAGRDMNAAAAPCRVNPGGMAGPACSKRRVWGAERQCCDERNAGQDRDRPADAAPAPRGFAAPEVRLHDILLQSLRRAIWSTRRKVGLANRPVNPRKPHEFAIASACANEALPERLPAIDGHVRQGANVKPRAGSRSQRPPPARPRPASWSCRRSGRRTEKCARR